MSYIWLQLIAFQAMSLLLAGVGLAVQEEHCYGDAPSEDRIHINKFFDSSELQQTKLINFWLQFN